MRYDLPYEASFSSIQHIGSSVASVRVRSIRCHDGTCRFTAVGRQGRRVRTRIGGPTREQRRQITRAVARAYLCRISDACAGLPQNSRATAAFPEYRARGRRHHLRPGCRGPVAAPLGVLPAAAVRRSVRGVGHRPVPSSADPAVRWDDWCEPRRMFTPRPCRTPSTTLPRRLDEVGTTSRKLRPTRFVPIMNRGSCTCILVFAFPHE
jgi:hypothetical protein